MSADRPSRSGKGPTVLTLLILAGALYLLTTRQWLSGVAAGEAFPVTGAQATAIPAAMAIVAAAAALFIALAGRIGRIVASLIIALAAVGYAAATVSVLLDPAAAAGAEIGANTGLETVADSATLTVWPTIALIAAAGLLAAAVYTMIASQHWKLGRKYERAQAKSDVAPGEDGELDTTDSWDALTRGEDPTARDD